ncbi:MAG: sulfite exporter TauE/SafE family protein [Lachnospiraceae bacterium]
MIFLVFLVCLFASAAGSICGIGGGVIIKPVLDALGIMSVSEISFLSGCTVFAMSLVSVYRNVRNKNAKLNLKTATSLAIGAAAGGILGKTMFQELKNIVESESMVGLVQASVLIGITGGTLLYTIWKEKIKTKQYRNPVLCLGIGILLGIMSSFLGIGGGPINLVVLVYCFSMTTKEAALSSLYIIMFSQAASLVQTCVTHTVPKVEPIYFVVMVLGGILGGNLGSRLNGKIKDKKVNQLFMMLMGIIILINIYNVVQFAMQI